MKKPLLSLLSLLLPAALPSAFPAAAASPAALPASAALPAALPASVLPSVVDGSAVDIPVSPASPSPVDYVSTLVGTLSKHSLSTGNTYPAVALPWGMNFWTPQTGRMGDGWQYVYTEDKIRGLKQTHQPSPWINDYGQFAIMPTTGDPRFAEDDRASWFSHKAEVAKPYYYSVYLADWDVTAELAPTERAAILRFTYPETAQANIVVDAFDGGSSVTVDPQRRRITGYTVKNSGGVPQNFRNYFVIEIDHPFTLAQHVDDQGRQGAVVTMSTRRGEQVTLRVASSFISPEQALRNLQELGPRSFEQVCADGRQRWNDVLGRIELSENTSHFSPLTSHLQTFYSCLYRSVLFPRAFYEIDDEGKPVHYSPHTGDIRSGYYFTDTGFWDTFRCLFPLLNLVYPEMAVKMQEGLVNCYLESGFLPEWASPGHRGCMVGNNSASVVADAWLKLSLQAPHSAPEGATISSSLNNKTIEAPSGAVGGALASTLWQAVVHGANAVHPDVPSTGRLGWEYYNRLGYVPYNVGINENVARTLEYAYDDWCIYKLGQALGKSKKELKPFREHALNYRNVFDPETRLMRGRNADGSFQAPFSPLKWGDAFTEGNAWHYTWSVFHDPEGLIRLMGGRDVFTQMLDSVFNVPPLFDESYYGAVIHEIREMQIMNMGNYAHGNQPIQHMIYLYDWALQPWKAQQRIREVMDRFYNANPDGYCGDEDNGQTSAWYVFSALGFYPVCPGSGQYAIGTPRFPRAVVHLPNGRDITIEADAAAASPAALPPYIGAMTLDGQPYDRNYLNHADLIRGARIHFQMQPTPNLTRGTHPAAAPYSFTLELEKK
ncbi:MAG: GH92 family glycosyl hydrolase [Prevotella sp.]|nr:GH92 family glycosyl hydrolase [Prevotella sp.]